MCYRPSLYFNLTKQKANKLIFAILIRISKKMMEEEWFESWFDTSYYHILYNNRNTEEAAHFIDNLFEHFHPQKEAKLLDIACGKGRHARHMSEMGFDTTGIDLSSASITYAKQYENDRLHFARHDMRKPFRHETFDYAFNLFTSFGYFQTIQEHVDALKAFNDSLKPGGIFVLDFFNSVKIINELIPSEKKEEKGIVFTISKELKDKKIIKKIEFEDLGKKHLYLEKVYAFFERDFIKMMEESNFKIIDKFGDYNFNSFDEKVSPRLILICQKEDARTTHPL